MKKKNTYNLLIIFGLFLLSSCEKEISIDLNKSNPKFVIEGNISNSAGESKVMITKTLNFDENTEFPTVSGALVTITDTLLHKIDTLIESTAGMYTNPSLMGKEGHTYKLAVKIDTETFTSISTMPLRLLIDSLYQMPDLGAAGPPAGTPGAGTTIRIMPAYKNFTGTDKYYQVVIIKNDTLINNITTRSDLGATGISFPFPLFIQAKKDDVLNIDIQFINKKAYDFLYGLSRNIGQFSATPSNPTSNISNGALGFFKAHTSQKTMFIVK